MRLEMSLQPTLQNGRLHCGSSKKQATGSIQQDVLEILCVCARVSIKQSIKIDHRVVHLPCEGSPHVLQADGRVGVVEAGVTWTPSWRHVQIRACPKVIRVEKEQAVPADSEDRAS